MTFNCDASGSFNVIEPMNLDPSSSGIAEYIDTLLPVTWARYCPSGEMTVVDTFHVNRA